MKNNKTELKQELIIESQIIRNLAYQFKEYSHEQIKLLFMANEIEKIERE